MILNRILQRIALFLLLVFALQCQAAFFSSVQRYSIEDGLPATTIFTLLKDESGYFWLGTPKGLVRYDGYNFEVYSRNNKDGLMLATPDAGNVFVDSKKRMWVGSWGKGLTLYNSKFEFIKHFQHDDNNINSIGSNLIQTFFEDSKGRVWIGTNGGGLARFRDKSLDFINYPHTPKDPTSLNHSRVWSIAETQDGSLWVATGSGLNKMLDEKQGKFQHFEHDSRNKKTLDHPLVRTLLVDEKNQLWIGTETGFGLFDHQKEMFYPYHHEKNEIDAAITKLRSGGEGIIWVGTQKGLYRFESSKGKFTPLVNDDNYALLPHDDIRDIYVDSEQSIWVATRYAGLTRIDLAPSIFEAHKKYLTPDGYTRPVQKVYDIHTDSQDVTWVGTSSGLLRLAKAGLFQYEIEDLDNNDNIYSIAEDKAGNIWLGSEKGLGMLSPDRSQYVTKNKILGPLQNININKLMFDRSNNLWIATAHNGLVMFNGKSTRIFKHNPAISDSISGNNITALFEDDKGRVWIGTSESGVNRLDPGRTRFFRYQNSPNKIGTLGVGAVNDIYQSSNGIMWIGTTESLNKLIDVTDTFERFSARDGISNSSIKAIIEDDYGDLWLSTNSGLSQFKPSQDFFVNHGQRKTVSSNQFLRNSVLFSKTHGLLFGGDGAVLRVHTNSPTYQSKIYKPQVTSVWIDGTRVHQYSFGTDDTLVLNHSVKSIRINFSSLNFINKSRDQYSYRIIGFNDSWSPLESNNQVNFSGLDSGNYIFQVRSNSSIDLWEEPPTSLRIKIETPWYKQSALYLMIILMAIVSAVVWYKYRTRSLARQKQALEDEISFRTRELFDAQKQLIESEKNASLSGLVAGVAHEINTPIGISVTAASNLVERSKLMINALNSKRLKRSEFETQIDNIHESAEMVLSNLLRASDLIGSFKEVSVDQISQQRRKFLLAEYMDEIIMSLTPKLKSENINITLKCPDDLIIDSYPGAIAQLITNLVMNSIVHAFDEKKEGNIDILIAKMNTQPEKLYIKFSDDGKGISEDNLDKIFEPFYTTKRGKGGSGLGLQIISNITNIRLGGNIRCESQPGEGTTFHIEVLSTPD